MNYGNRMEQDQLKEWETTLESAMKNSNVRERLSSLVLNMEADFYNRALDDVESSLAKANNLETLKIMLKEMRLSYSTTDSPMCHSMKEGRPKLQLPLAAPKNNQPQ